MRFTSFFVKNYQLTLVLFLMIVVVSITTILSTCREQRIRTFNPPQFPIVIMYPGTSPKDMEELVVKPIEKKVSELEDIKRIKTQIDDGVAVIEVEYKYE